MHSATITVVEMLADGIISDLTGRLVEQVVQKLRSDPAKVALQQAIAVSLRRYITSDLRGDISEPLLDAKGVFSDNAVIAEVAKLLAFNGESPNAEVIATVWSRQIIPPQKWRDFVKETHTLLSLIEGELRVSDVFREAFSARDLSRIAEHTQVSSDRLMEVIAELSAIRELLTTQFVELIKAINASSASSRMKAHDFSELLAEKTDGFVGRSFVFDGFQTFCNDFSSGYFVVMGDPGIGKSALTAALVRDQGYIHHFNIRSEGINRADNFVRNTCAQLAAKYALSGLSLPDSPIRDAQPLNDYLQAVARQIHPGKPAILVIDALDEANYEETRDGANTLFLPMKLPDGIYIFVTSRPDYRLVHLNTECAKRECLIDQKSAENLSDIHRFLTRYAQRGGIQRYIAAQEIDEELFVGHLAEKSEGNFMYLRYVLPEIERGSYRGLELRTLPSGLAGYYAEQWRRMREVAGERGWFEHSLPVLTALTIASSPLSIDILTRDSGVRDPLMVFKVLEEWAPYLYREQIDFNGTKKMCYRLYHTSFYDFIKEHEQVALDAAEQRRKMRQRGLLGRGSYRG